MKSQVRPKHLRRLVALGFFFVLGFLGLAWRLVDVQIFSHERYRELAAQNTRHISLEEPRRGDILDSQGNLMATSLPVKKVIADPYFVGPFYHHVAEAIAPLLGLDIESLAQDIKPSVLRINGRMVQRRWKDLDVTMTSDEWQRVAETMKNLQPYPEGAELKKSQKQMLHALRTRAIYAEDHQQRVYPNGPLASHVLGFIRTTSEEFNHATLNQIQGVYGIEHWYNGQLAGARGWKITEVDERKRELVVYREQNVEPRSGLNVVLTLDLAIQEYVEEVLRDAMEKFEPISASCVVVRPQTGEILAMASLPSFDPNDVGSASTVNLKNRVIADWMEPGSTYKIVTLASALNESTVQLTDTIYCENGYWNYLGKPLRDANHQFGVLTVQEVLAKSSNIGFAKIALALGKERLYHYARAFGFGQKTGVTLTGETAGRVIPLDEWNGLTITRMPMGQSIAVTHLQMTMAMAAIANGGWLMRPMLVKRLEDADGSVFVQYPPQPSRKVIHERTARETIKAMRTVVETGGTGISAGLEHYTVAGKTGTAQIPLPGGRGYMAGKNLHSFMGFLPASQPEVCISVVLEQPEHGRYASQTAAPSFQRIAEYITRYLKIRPDRTLTIFETEQAISEAQLAINPSLEP